MKKSRLLRIAPMLLLLIIIGTFLFQLKSNKNSILNTNTKIVCVTSICVKNENGQECIYLKSKLSYLDVKSNNILLTQTLTDCREQ